MQRSSGARVSKNTVEIETYCETRNTGESETYCDTRKTVESKTYCETRKTVESETYCETRNTGESETYCETSMFHFQLCFRTVVEELLQFDISSVAGVARKVLAVRSSLYNS